jgi:hypothetical protein
MSMLRRCVRLVKSVTAGKEWPGQDAVEFALVLPFLFLIFFGVVDLGRILHASITITNAAREGARYGMANADDWGGVVLAVQDEALGSGIDLSDVDISTITVSCPDRPEATACVSGEPIRVEVDYTFSLMIAMVFAESELPVYSRAEMLVP